MTYTEILETIQKLAAEENYGAIASLISYKNAKVVAKAERMADKKYRYYAQLRLKYEVLADKTDAELDAIFTKGLSADEINKLLAQYGIIHNPSDEWPTSA